jgi:DNA-binding SARP family transcriptional activator/class 3 adenylate cyclase
MEFRILGPLEVLSSGRPVPLGGPRQRALLALLLVHAGQVVSTDRLVDELWGEEDRNGAVHALQSAVSRLRRALGPDSARVVARSPGYVLELEPGQLDVHRFETLRAEGLGALSTGDGAEAARVLGEALRLWRGTALADFSYEPFAQAEIARLEELRLATLEDRIEADLALGRHAEVVGELRSVIPEHPFRERLRAQLVLSLYRSGRQAEALEAYREARNTLVEELGIEPGPALQDLEAAVLRQDSGLLLPAPRTPATEGRGLPVVVEEAPPPVPETRKTVTAVFCDMADSTPLAERLDPEAMRLVLARYFEVAASCFHRHGGTVEKFIGDAVVAIFGVPALHEDDALRGVRAAVELRDRLPELNVELDRDFGVQVSLRIGVNTGEVVAGDASSGQALVTGDPVNTAARLQQMAEPGEILLGEATFVLVHGAVQAESLPDLALKAKTGPVRARRLLAFDPTAPPFPRRLDAPLVGRTGELAQLRVAFERAVKDNTAVLFSLIGPPGIGKTRLAQEFASSVQDEATVVTGRCLPYGEGITYWPLRELLHTAFGDDVRPEVERLLADDPDAGAIADRVASATGLGGGVFPKEELTWATRKTLEALTRSRPLVVVLEDLHWAEPAFLDLVEHVASLATDAPILLVGLARPELLEDRAGWGGGIPNASSILLEPLEEKEARALVANLAEETGLITEAARTIDIAEGNPLFLEQIAAARAEAPAGENLLVPPTIRALLAARLERLGPGERAVLERAAVVGKEFYAEAVAELLPPETRPTLSRHLEALARRRYVRPAPPFLGQPSFQFRHILIRDAAYQSVPKAARADLHERFAAWMEGALGERVEEYEEILGYHLEQASLNRLTPAQARDRELAARASALLASAGRRALDRDDALAAVNLLTRALHLIPRDDPQNLRIQLPLGMALHFAGELERATQTFTEVADRATVAGDRAMEWQARVHRTRSLASAGADMTGDEVQLTAEQAIEVFAEMGDEWGLAQGWSLLAWHWQNAGQVGAAVDAIAQSVSHARLADRPNEELYGLSFMASCASEGPMPVPDALRLCHEVLGRVKGRRYLESRVHLERGRLEAMLGNFAAARAAVAQATAEFRDFGSSFMLTGMTVPAADVRWYSGDYAGAEREWRSGYEAHKRMGAEPYLATFAAELARVLVELGRDDEALELTQESEELADRDDATAQVPWRCARARILARRREADHAEQLAREAVNLAERTDWLNLRGEALMDLADVLRLVGRRGEAAEAARDAAERFEQKGNLVSEARARALVAELSKSAQAPSAHPSSRSS